VRDRKENEASRDVASMNDLSFCIVSDDAGIDRLGVRTDKASRARTHQS